MKFIMETSDVVSLPLGRGSKYGTVDVECARFSDEVNTFVYLYGLRQIINDAMATKTDSEGNELSDAEIIAKASKRLINLYEGVIRTRGESAEPADPVEAIAWSEAKKVIESSLRQQDLWKDIPKGTKNRVMFVLNRARAAKGMPEMEEADAIEAILAKDPSIRRRAKQTVDNRNKLADATSELF